MAENKKSARFDQVVAGLSTAWKTYKTSVRRRGETSPMETFVNDLFGKKASDIDAIKFLAQDVAEIRNKLNTKRTNKKFADIIDNSY